MTDQPVAIPQVVTPAEVEAARSGTNTAPPAPTSDPHDPALLGFHKIAAERNTRIGTPPKIVPFGKGTIRIHATMGAGFAFDAAAAEADPFAAKRMIRDAIVTDDQAEFDRIMLLAPDNPQGVDGPFLIGFLQALGQLYAAVPLGG